MSSAPVTPRPREQSGYFNVTRREKNFAKFLTQQVFPVYIVPFLLCFILNKYFEWNAWVLVALFIVYNRLQPFFQWVYKSFIRTPKNPLSYGKWAIITGATAGIGKSYAEQFAALRVNIFIISRSEAKLKDVASEIAKHSNVQIQYFAADFTTMDDNTYTALRARLEKLDDIGILINNVGIANETPELMHLLTDKETEEMVEINILGTIKMTRLLMPFFLKKNKGCIINVSSGSAVRAMPMLAVYSATKAFILQFSRSISYEYKEYGIDIMCTTPLYVVSNLSKFKKSSLIICSAEQYVRDSLKYLGYEVEISPYWFHAFIDFVADIYWDTPNGLLQMMKRNKNRGTDRKGGAEKKTD